MNADPRRQDMLDRIRAAVRAGNHYRDPATEMKPTVGYYGAGADPVARFVEELLKVGVHARHVATPAEACTAIADICRKHSARRAILNDDPILAELDVARGLRLAGLDVTSSIQLGGLDEPARREQAFAADVGIAAPDWAIAETGSLVYVASPLQSRSASLLPPLHIAIIDTGRILADLFDLPARLTGGASELAANVVLVTGPSKTGDIELRLTTGVHGPGEVHALVWARR